MPNKSISEKIQETRRFLVGEGAIRPVRKGSPDDNPLSMLINPEGASHIFNLDEPALLVTPFNYENNFRGFLDGEEIEVWRANANMAAIFLPAGEHLLELKIRDGFYNICMMIQGILLAAAMLAALWVVWGSKKEPVNR